MTTRIFAPASAALLVLCASCATTPPRLEPGTQPAAETSRYTLGNTDRFEKLDATIQRSVDCTGIQEHPLADGRLEIIANLKNRESHRVQVQIDCLFKDEQGMALGDETPYQTLTLAENATETVRFTAANVAARKYTIRVRAPQ